MKSSNVNVPFLTTCAQGNVIVGSYLQEFVEKNYSISTLKESVADEAFSNPSFNRGLQVLTNRYFENLRAVRVELASLHRLAPFKWIHEFYRVQDLFFLYVEELIMLYHLQNPDDYQIDKLYMRLKIRYALISLRLFNVDKQHLWKTFEQIIKRLQVTGIFDRKVKQICDIYKNILNFQYMPDVNLAVFYHPSLVDAVWIKRCESEAGSHMPISCSFNVVKAIFQKKLCKLKVEASLFCEMIPLVLEKEAVARKKIEKETGCDTSMMEQAIHTPALEYQKRYVSYFFPKVCQLTTIDIFSVSNEELEKWRAFFSEWAELLNANFRDFRPVSREKEEIVFPYYVRKWTARLNRYQDTYLQNELGIICDLLKGIIYPSSVKKEELEVIDAEPLDTLNRAYFNTHIASRRVISKEKVSSVKKETSKPKRAHKKKNHTQTKKETSKEDKIQKEHKIVEIGPLYSSFERRVECIDLKTITPTFYNQLAYKIYEISLEKNVILNPLPLRHLARCVHHLSALYGLVNLKGGTRGIGSFTLYSTVVEESARAMEQFFDAHFQEIPYTHDLNALAAVVFSGSSFPKIVQKLHMGTFWSRYFEEEKAHYERKLTFISQDFQIPKVLSTLQALAHQPEAMDTGFLKKKLIKILEQTANFLAANLDIEKEKVHEIKVLNKPKSQLHFKQEIVDQFIQMIEDLPSLDPIIQQKAFQLKICLKTLKEIFIGCRRSPEFSTFAFWANKLIWQMQHIVAESLTLLIYMRTGVIETNHDIEYLSRKAALELTTEETAPFQNLSIKARYPARLVEFGEGGKMIHEIEVLLRHPEIDQDFTVDLNENDPWVGLPKKGVKVEVVSKSLVAFINHALIVLNDKIMPALHSFRDSLN